MRPDIEIHRQTPSSPYSYRDLCARNREIQSRVLAGGAGALVRAEVAPVITLGRRTVLTDLLWSRSEYERHGIEILSVDRGGFATWHGPGQWILFPCDTLERWTGSSRGVRSFVDQSLEATLAVVRAYRSEAVIREGVAGQVGIFTPRGKLASLGIRVDRGVVMHGLSVNGFLTPESFRGLRPCGQEAAVDACFDADPGPDAFERLGQRLVEEFLNLSRT